MLNIFVVIGNILMIGIDVVFIFEIFIVYGEMGGEWGINK